MGWILHMRPMGLSLHLPLHLPDEFRQLRGVQGLDLPLELGVDRGSQRLIDRLELIHLDGLKGCQ